MKKQLIDEEELGGLPEAGCCLVFVFSVTLLLTSLINGFETKKHVQGSVARVTWERTITIEADLGGRNSRGEVIWERVDRLKTSGEDNIVPYWPAFELQKNQRVGFRVEHYYWYVIGEDGKTWVESTSDYHRWLLIPVGTRVTLGIDGFDTVKSIARVTSSSIEAVTSESNKSNQIKFI